LGTLIGIWVAVAVNAVASYFAEGMSMQIAIAVAVHVKHPRSSMGIAPKVRFALTPRWRE
jgi:hypothetical protein